MNTLQKPSSGRLRIAFNHISGEGWSAGTYYLKNLFYALRSLPESRRPEICLLVSEGTLPETYDELVFLVDHVLPRPAVAQRIFFAELLYNIRKKSGFFSEKENQLSAFLRNNGVKVFFTLGPPGPNFMMPVLSWIPDFQHLHYPHFFSVQEINRRNISFEFSAQRATRVVLSSNSALDDFKTFAPWAAEKASVLSFVAQIPSEVYTKDAAFVCDKYNIPKRFILLPNQFWKHKNHETVISALQLALKEEPRLTIVCTGNTNEYRDQGYFSRLLCSISEAGVRKRMIILGLVPRMDLFFLMRQSLAVLQPSLFEGWNTAVEEVKSLGKKLIVSDIRVHREQDSGSVIYFKPTEFQSLAKHLLDIFSSGHFGPDFELERLAKELLVNRTTQYGEKFMDICQGSYKG